MIKTNKGEKMKTLLTTIAVLLTFNVSAARPSANQSWDELKANNSLDIKFPAARMNHGPATGVDFLCLDGEVLRTKKLIEKCTKQIVTPGRNGELKCVSTVKEFGVVEREQETTRCVQYSRNNDSMECVKYEDYTYVQPLSFNVEVYKYNTPKKTNSTKIFSKRYDITECK